MTRITSLVPIKANSTIDEKLSSHMLISGINRIADLINSLNRDMESRTLWVISIILGSISGFLLGENKALLAIFFFEILIAFLLLTLIKENKEKGQLQEEADEIIKNAKTFGLDLNYKK